MQLHVPQTHFNTRQHTANPVSHVLAHTPLQRNCLEANPSHCIIPTKNTSWGFPGEPVVKILHYQCWGQGVLSLGTAEAGVTGVM